MEKSIIIHTDGGSRGNPGNAACAFVAAKNDEQIYTMSKYLGINTNNVAEYNGVIIALEWLISENIEDDVEFYLDSELVVKQIQGVYKIKNANLLDLNIKIKKLIKNLKGKIVFNNVPREQNKIADKLLNEELDKH